jgi:hypothetical protein
MPDELGHGHAGAISGFLDAAPFVGIDPGRHAALTPPVLRSLPAAPRMAIGGHGHTMPGHASITRAETPVVPRLRGNPAQKWNDSACGIGA